MSEPEPKPISDVVVPEAKGEVPTRASMFRKVFLGILTGAIFALIFIKIIPQLASYEDIWAEVRAAPNWEILGLLVIGLVIMVPVHGDDGAADPRHRRRPGLHHPAGVHRRSATRSPARQARACGSSCCARTASTSRTSAAAWWRSASGTTSACCRCRASPCCSCCSSGEGGDETSTLAGWAIFAVAVSVALILGRHRAAAQHPVRAWLGRVGQRLTNFFLRLIRKPEVDGWEAACVTLRANTVTVLKARGGRLTVLTLSNYWLNGILLILCLRLVGIDSEILPWDIALATYTVGRLSTVIQVTPGGVGVVEVAYTAAFVAVTSPTYQDHDHRRGAHLPRLHLPDADHRRRVLLPGLALRQGPRGPRHPRTARRSRRQPTVRWTGRSEGEGLRPPLDLGAAVLGKRLGRAARAATRPASAASERPRRRCSPRRASSVITPGRPLMAFSSPTNSAGTRSTPSTRTASSSRSRMACRTFMMSVPQASATSGTVSQASVSVVRSSVVSVTAPSLPRPVGSPAPDRPAAGQRRATHPASAERHPGQNGARLAFPTFRARERTLGQMTTQVTDPVVGRLLDGRYRVGERIARGGMATVYSGLDTRLDRPVAVKIMHPGFADDEDFVGALHARGPLGRPAVAPQRRRGLRPGRGRRHRLPRHGVRRRPHAARPAPRARTAHARRGASTSSSRCWPRSPPPTTRASCTATSSRRTCCSPTTAGSRSPTSAWPAPRPPPSRARRPQGVLIGTVAYLSPEQVERGIADARSDVYSAGIVLYELLTGSPAVHRRVPDGRSPTSTSTRTSRPRPPWCPACIPSVDALVSKATRRDPDQRPADAGRLLQAVRRAASAGAGRRARRRDSARR